jgi:hypothetical protein
MERRAGMDASLYRGPAAHVEAHAATTATAGWPRTPLRPRAVATQLDPPQLLECAPQICLEGQGQVLLGLRSSSHFSRAPHRRAWPHGQQQQQQAQTASPQMQAMITHRIMRCSSWQEVCISIL